MTPQERKEYNKKYRQAHKEANREKDNQRYRKYRETHKKEIQNYLKTHKKEIQSRGKKYRTENKKILLDKRKKYYQDHKNKTIASVHLYQQMHPEIKRKADRVRRARKLAVHEHYTVQDEQYTLSLFGHKCFNCGQTQNLTIDHIYPLSSGNPLSRQNACVLCKSCNCSKHNKLPENFYPFVKLIDLFILVGLHSVFPEACDSLTCSCL